MMWFETWHNFRFCVSGACFQARLLIIQRSYTQRNISYGNRYDKEEDAFECTSIAFQFAFVFEKVFKIKLYKIYNKLKLKAQDLFIV